MENSENQNVGYDLFMTSEQDLDRFLMPLVETRISALSKPLRQWNSEKDRVKQFFRGPVDSAMKVLVFRLKHVGVTANHSVTDTSAMFTIAKVDNAEKGSYVFYIGAIKDGPLIRPVWSNNSPDQTISFQFPESENPELHTEIQDLNALDMQLIAEFILENYINHRHRCYENWLPPATRSLIN